LSLSISSKNFSFVYNNGVVIKTPQILYRVICSNSSGNIGFIVSRRLGSACQRNLFRRRMRFLYGEFFKNQRKIDVIIAPKTINLGWEEIRNSFKFMVNKAYDF